MASALLTFEILWYAGGPEWAPNRCIGRTRIRRRDLSAACKAAGNIFAGNAKQSDTAQMARGFYVREVK